MKKFIAMVCHVGWVVALSFIGARLDPLKLGYEWAYALTFVIVGSAHWAMLSMHLSVHCLVRCQESLSEGVSYICSSSPFSNKNGIVLRLAPATESQDGYDEKFWSVPYNYYFHSYDPEILGRLEEGGECVVKLHEGSLTLIEPQD